MSEAEKWADAFRADLAALPFSQRRAFIEGKVLMRGNTERDTATQQMNVLSLPERVPGQHLLARQRLRDAANALTERVGELAALDTPDTPQDARFAAATQLPGLAEFCAVCTQALTVAQ